MELISVNIGSEQPIQNAKAVGKTGIYKQPVATPVHVSVNGLPNDAICDTPNHGGVDQAVYVYGQPDYEWWSHELGYPLLPGTFGENLTIAGFESSRAVIGDRFHIGAVTLEITAPRIPCVTLARRMDDPAFLKRFRAAERPGVYCRVITEGDVQSGNPVTYEPSPDAAVTSTELFRDAFESVRDEATIRRHLAAPIAIRARVAKERELAELLAGAGASA